MPMMTWTEPPDDLSLSDIEIHIWRANLDLPGDQVQQLQSWLSDDEIKRADRFYFQRDRNRFIVARGRLREILSRYTQQEPGELTFRYNQHGKPALDHTIRRDRVEFNLSHSQDLALIAVTRISEVGIDVESVLLNFTGEEIASRFFSPHEVQAIRTLPPEIRQEAFFSCWTRKESYIKARGKGLAIPLDDFDVSVGPGEPARLVANRADPDEVARWCMYRLEPGPGYVGAITIATGEWDLKYWNWKWKRTVSP